MNKLLLFPLAIMFFLTLMITMVIGVEPSGTSGDFTDTGGIIMPGSDSTNGSVEIPQGGSHTFDIWDSTGILVIMIVAIGIGIVAGIRVIGSGLSPESQMMIFNSIFFLGLWSCLTVISRDVLFENSMTSILWFILTAMFVVGLATHLNRNATEG